MGTSNKDAALEAAQREFNSTPATDWQLKPHESVCSDCHLVRPCDCGVY